MKLGLFEAEPPACGSELKENAPGVVGVLTAPNENAAPTGDPNGTGLGAAAPGVAPKAEVGVREANAAGVAPNAGPKPKGAAVLAAETAAGLPNDPEADFV